MKDIEINRVRDLRNDIDKTQKQVAEDLNRQVTTYARWEQNPMTMKFPDIIALAKYYNVSIDYIAGLTNSKKKEW